MNILLIEDDVLVRKAISHFLLESGHTVSIAVNGQEAIGCVEKNRNVDLVICDVMMPKLTGPSFILSLKTYFPKKQPRVIIISGDKVGEDYLRQLEIPYDLFLQKPVNPGELEKFIRGLSGEAAA